MKFYVVAIARGDEFTEGIFDTVREMSTVISTL